MPAVRRLLAGALAGAVLVGPVAAGAPDARAQETSRSCDPENPQHIGPRFTNGPLEALSSPALRSRATGDGVTVAVVDSGVDVRNEHFPPGSVLPGRSFVPGYSDARESAVVHGTAVAGLIGARKVPGSTVVGLAPDATILPVRVFVSDNPNDENPGLDPAADRIAAGIRWAADEGADVINVSMSSLEPLDALDRAVRHATQQGSLVVASAGNNPDGEGPAFTHRVWPAASPGALGVTATDTSGTVTDWSTHGPHVDVSAPGQQVHAPHWNAGDCQLSGNDGEPITSFATPFVSATAALLMEAHPDEGPRRIAYRIQASADRPLQAARDDARGWGFIRPYEALTMTLDPSRPGPPFPGRDRGGAADGGGDAVRLRASTDPLAGAQRQAAWWLLLGTAAVVLVLIVGRGVALAGPPTGWFGSLGRRTRAAAVPDGGEAVPAPHDRASRDAAEALVDADAQASDEASEQAAGRGQRDEPSFVHRPGQGVVASPTTGSLPRLSPHLTGAVSAAERPSAPATSAPAPSASVSGSIPLPASVTGPFAAPVREGPPSAPTGSSAPPDWGRPSGEPSGEPSAPPPAPGAGDGRTPPWSARLTAPPESAATSPWADTPSPETSRESEDPSPRQSPWEPSSERPTPWGESSSGTPSWSGASPTSGPPWAPAPAEPSWPSPQPPSWWQAPPSPPPPPWSETPPSSEPPPWSEPSRSSDQPPWSGGSPTASGEPSWPPPSSPPPWSRPPVSSEPPPWQTGSPWQTAPPWQTSPPWEEPPRRAQPPWDDDGAEGGRRRDDDQQ